MKRLVAALAAFLLASTGAALAQGYPAKPITIVVPFSVGSTTDIMTRAIATGLSQRVGQAVVVDNRAGAGGNIGTELAAKAAPDGYTLIMGTNGPFAANLSLYDRVPFDPVRDFTPIIHVVATPLIMVAHPSVQAASVSDVVKLAKSRPGTLNFGVTNTTARVWVELFKKMAGVEVVPVLYKNVGGMVSDLVGGQIQFAIENVGPTLPHVRSGKLKAMAMMYPKRAEFAPEIPSLHESGLNQYDVVGWLALFAPRGTPPAIVTRLNTELAAVIQSPEVRQVLAANAIVVGGSPEQLGATLKTEIGKWRDLVQSTGVRLE